MNSFKQMLANKTIKRTDNGQFIRLADIHVKPGFNKRNTQDPEYLEAMGELVSYLEAGGEVPPLEVHARDEGGVWVVEGHRRREAFGLLAAAGKPVEWIHIKQFNGNDAERIARIATSASQLQLKPLERAAVYAELRALNWSDDDIAKRMGKHVSHVRSHLALIDANTDVQTMVKNGEVSATVAVQHVKSHGEKAGAVLAEKLDQAKAQGKSKVTKGTDKASKATGTFQERVQPWLVECFGEEIASDKLERNYRFLEEALELVQATGCTQREAHQLVDYVFGRPVGEPAQEVGGVMVTLAALCLAHRMDMHGAGETELERIWTKVEQIRAKQAAKPKQSPLPM